MPAADDLTAIEALVRERVRAALADKTAYERDGQRLNSQLMQGELNMGSAVLAWIEQRRGGEPPEPDDESEEPD